MPLTSALPIVPGLGCPSVAGAIGAVGLGPVCQVAGGASSIVGSAASQVAGIGVDSVLNALGNWVSSGAVWLLGQIGTVLSATTSIDLGASWFVAHEQAMTALAGVVVVPLLLLGIIQAVYRQDMAMLLRSALVHVPLALLLTVMAVKLVQLGLALTDAMSAAVSQGAGLDGGHFMGNVVAGLSATGATGQPGAPAFVVFLGGLAVVFGAVLVWIELIVRAAAVYVAVLFLPLALVSLAFPAVGHWCRRLVDTLVALILGKFVIVSVLSLAAGALAAGAGSSPSGGPPGGGGGFAAVVEGAALLMLASLTPWALLRLLPFVEAGAIGHLEGVGRQVRQHAAVPARGLAQIAMRSAVAGSIAGQGVDELTGGATGRFGDDASGGLGGDPPGGAPGSGPRGRMPGGGPPGRTSSSGADRMAQSGVGPVEPPGSGIPMWEPDPELTERAEAAMRRLALDPHEPPEVPAAAPGGPESGGDLVVLPRQSGLDHPDLLGRDALGIKLIGAPGPGASREPRAEPDPR